MALVAGDVRLDRLSGIRGPLEDIGSNAQASLSGALSGARTSFDKNRRTAGRIKSTYAPQRFNEVGDLASRQLEDSLYGGVGKASLSDLLAQKQFEQDVALANEIGDINRPSTLQEVLGGLGGAATLGAEGYGLYSGLGKHGGGGSGQPFYGVASNPYGYNTDSIRGYSSYPNELRVR